MQTAGRCNVTYWKRIQRMVVFTLQTAGRCNFCCCFFHSLLVVFTFQTAGRCNGKPINNGGASVVFTFQTAGRCNTPIYLELHESVVFTLQTAGRCNRMWFFSTTISVVFTLQTAGRCNLMDFKLLELQLFLPFKQQADATQWCYYQPIRGCFYLSNSRQMQRYAYEAHNVTVVFTFQTAGRCNYPEESAKDIEVVFTFQTAGRCNWEKFPFVKYRLFLPFKQQADATVCINLEKYLGCFYLANSRQMQQSFCFRSPVVSCFYLANSRQMQQDGSEFKIDPSCFYLANSRQMQHKRLRTLFWIVVFTLQTAGRCNRKI